MKGVSKSINIGTKMSLNDFFKMFLATTMSIVLTFGTSAFLERREKKQAQKQMCMMILHDIDESLETIQLTTERLDKMYEMQQQIAEKPSYWNNMSNRISFAYIPIVNFKESFEKIFTSGPEIWSTLGNAIFIDNVNDCYTLRHQFLDDVIKPLKEFQIGIAAEESPDKALDLDLADMIYETKVIALEIEHINEYNKQLMDVTPEDMEAFLKNKVINYDQQRYDSLVNAYEKEYRRRAYRAED